MEYKVLEQSAFLGVFLVTINVTLAFLIILLACLNCCKQRKIPKNELLGLEGMVKLKNPDEIVVTSTVVGKSESHADLNASTISNGDSEKRASTAAHRSLPDIPVAEANGDTGSELYETVADKRLMEAQSSQDKSPSPNLKKEISVSQHSSISQADDISSPYSRVKNSPHGYAKVLSAEHPYAQLNAPSTSTAAAAPSILGNSLALHESNNSNSQHNNSTQDSNISESQVDIPAASAIAGMISASQDLPYMTPPVANQHFSGDSQDSSKGYTSISVREPLANILAQQPSRRAQNNSNLSRDVNDSHYATVSDDSDETYAAIEDPNLRNNANLAADIYTSGSETYAQIQPMVVSVEINNSSDLSNYQSIQSSVQHNVNSTSSITAPLPAHAHSHLNWPSVPASQIHSRQASSSSNNSSSVGNLGSPKPEKRQANSPLPPTPKSSGNLNTSSNSNLTSERNSVISVIELTGELTEVNDKSNSGVNDSSPVKKNNSLSPSRDIEGMYAKVMKKNKLSTHDSPPSHNNSPIMIRKHTNHMNATTSALGVKPLNSSTAALMESQRISISTGDRNRARCNSYGAKDHGYETIPADINRKSDCYTNILQIERQQSESNAPPNIINLSIAMQPSKTTTSIDAKFKNEKHYETITGLLNSNDPGYETLIKPKAENDNKNAKKSSDYDPNYEVVKVPNNNSSAGLSDDGYAKVLEKKRLNIDEDSIDGYSKVKGEETEDGYSTIRDCNEHAIDEDSKNHNYASISEAKSSEVTVSSMPDFSPLTTYSTPVKAYSNAKNEYKIRPNELPPILSPSSYNSSLLNTDSAASSANLKTASTVSTLSSHQTPSSSQYESLTGSETDPNYESVSYIQTNRSQNSDLYSYERLNAECSDTQLSSPRTPPHNAHTTSSTLTHSISTTGAAVILNVTTHTSTTTSASNTTNLKNTTELQTEVIVDDYFQV